MTHYIISDVHLGSRVCQCEKLLKFLSEIEKEQEEKGDVRLIINGDLFDSIHSRLKKNHWKILSKLRKMSDTMRIIWIRGNHDAQDAEIVSNLIGIELREHYFIVDNFRVLYCVHGDKWDEYIKNYPLITNIADWFYKNILQRIGLGPRAKRNTKSFLRNNQKIKEKAVEFLWTNQLNEIYCGHTHQAHDGGNYKNSGCWTEETCTYIKVTNGESVLLEFNK